jgi:hypothetical protein
MHNPDSKIKIVVIIQLTAALILKTACESKDKNTIDGEAYHYSTLLCSSLALCLLRLPLA